MLVPSRSPLVGAPRGLVRLGAVCAAISFWGCSGGQSGAEGVNQGPEECATDDECQFPVIELDRLSQPEPVDYSVASASCEPMNVSTDGRALSGTACICGFLQGSGAQIGPVGLGCHVYGRGGDCLWTDAEFSGCDINDGAACADVCAEVGLRREADAARSFTTELVYAACNQGQCESVVSINGRCYADFSYKRGESYDCALGVAAILEAHRTASQPPAPAPTVPSGPGSYLPGTNAFVMLTAATDYWGPLPGPTSFGVFAQFFDVEGEDRQTGEVLDPLDGVDDCGVSRLSSIGTAASFHFLSVAQASFHDAGAVYRLEEFRSGSDDFYSYLFDLSPAGVAPRYGGEYGFSASGGSFVSSIEVDGIVLPEALALPELEKAARLPRGALDLTWTGRGQAPLRLALDIEPKLSDFSNAYRIECVMADDGAFTIPAAVLGAAPDGFATAYFTRENRRVQTSGRRAIQSIAQVLVNHRFWLGPSCDGSALMDACQRSATEVRDRYAECASVAPPALEALCPAYLNEACGGCPQYYTCRSEATRCEAGELSVTTGCGCP